MTKTAQQTELKQAKQQSQDLHRTGDFFSTLLTLNPGDEMPKPPEGRAMEEPKQQPNGISHTAPFVEAVSPFSQPPAPPPQQPLPEKPDVARFASSDSLGRQPLQRAETERQNPLSNSPGRPEQQSSQILSLVEALNVAKKEIDSQGDRVKQLETLLKRERKARESAEERARRLLAGQSSPGAEQRDGTIEHDAFEPPMDPARGLGLANGSDSKSTIDDDRPEVTTIAASSKGAEELHRQTEDVDASTTRLRERVDQLMREMDQMKAQMESYKRRAEGAEAERTSLAEMIEKIRAEAAGKDSLSNGSIIHPSKYTPTRDSTGASSSAVETPRGTSGLWKGTSSSPTTPSSSLHHRKQPNGTLTASRMATEEKQLSNMQALEQSMAATLHSYASGPTTAQGKGGRDVAMQSAPYVSMVGVVLIGVGIMTWLNGWQKGER